MVVEIGDRLGGRYLVERHLGGGMADVFLAHDERLDRAVAIKAFRGSDTAERRRFDGETKLLAQLVHPNLVRVFDAGGSDDEPYLAMELVTGPNLAQLLADGPLGDARTEDIARGLSDALAYIHARGVVHRDLKPSNILIDADGQARLGDFGIARFIDATRLTRPATMIGTAAYMAPEQLDSDAKVGPPADVYALGLVLLECLTGTRPFVGSPQEVALARLARDPDIPDTVDPRWHRLLEDLTQRDPDARPRAAEVIHRLRHEVDGQAQPTLGATRPTATFDRQTPVTKAASRPHHGRRLLLLVCAGIAVTAIAVALLFGNGRATLLQAHRHISPHRSPSRPQHNRRRPSRLPRNHHRPSRLSSTVPSSTLAARRSARSSAGSIATSMTRGLEKRRRISSQARNACWINRSGPAGNSRRVAPCLSGLGGR